MNDQHPVLYSSYQWWVPTQFNIAQACLHRWSGNVLEGRRAAITHEDALGGRSDWTYGRLAEVSNRLANGLRKMGVQKGDRVAVIMPQRPEAIAASLAILSLGAILLPLPPQLGIDGLAQRLRDAEACVIISDAAAAPELPQVMNLCPSVHQLVGLDFENDLTLSWRTLLARESAEFEPVTTLAEDPAILIYTAGTTGLPKGVLHAHRVLIGILPAFVSAQNWYPRPADLFWSPVEWTTAPGLLHGVLAILYFGRQLVTTQVPLQGDLALALLRRHPITNTLLLPSDLALMREAAGSRAADTRLRAIMVAGDGLPAPVREWAGGALGCIPNEVYGLSEAPGIIGHSQEKWPLRPGSIGRPIPGHRVALIDSKGRPCRLGSVGQLALHVRDDHGHPDPALFLSYWRNEALTRARYLDDWFLTGDMASMDEDGYFWFVGRCDDVFRVGRHRVSPLEIEACLKQHPAVSQAAVVPKPHSVHGNVIKAFIVTRAAGSPDAVPARLGGELQAYVREHLAAWQVPEEVEFVDRLPLTFDGQIRRHVLRAREQQRSMLAACRKESRNG